MSPCKPGYRAFKRLFPEGAYYNVIRQTFASKGMGWYAEWVEENFGPWWETPPRPPHPLDELYSIMEAA